MCKDVFYCAQDEIIPQSALKLVCTLHALHPTTNRHVGEYTEIGLEVRSRRDQSKSNFIIS